MAHPHQPTDADTAVLLATCTLQFVASLCLLPGYVARLTALITVLIGIVVLHCAGYKRLRTRGYFMLPEDEALQAAQLSRLLSWLAVGLSGIGVLAGEPEGWPRRVGFGLLAIGIGAGLSGLAAPPKSADPGYDRLAAWIATAGAAIAIGVTAKDDLVVGAAVLWTVLALAGAWVAGRSARRARAGDAPPNEEVETGPDEAADELRASTQTPVHPTNPKLE